MRHGLISLRDIAVNLGLILINTAITYIGLFFTYAEFSQTAVWLPTGLLFTAYLLYKKQVVPAIILAPVIGTLLFSPLQGTELYMKVIGSSLITLCSVLFGSYLFEKYINRFDIYQSVSATFKFIASMMAVSAVSALLGIFIMLFTEPLNIYSGGILFFKWFFGDLLGLLYLTPLIFSLLRNYRIDYSLGGFLEIFSLFFLVVVFISLVFGPRVETELLRALPFLVLPVLMWIAFRFTEREAIMAAALIAVTATWSGTNSYGPFSFPNSDLALIILQIYLSVVTVVALVTTAAVQERRFIQEKMRNVSESLEKRVAKRTSELATLNKELLIEVNNRKKIEKALKENEDRLSFILDNVTDAIFTLNDKGHFLYQSPSVHTLFAMERKDINRGSFIDCLSIEAQAGVREKLMQVIRGTREIARLEYTLPGKDGSLIWHATTLTREINQEGSVVLIGVAKDITQQKQAEEERYKLEEQIRNAAKLESLGVLAGGIAHDFNNLLTAIMGNCGLAKMQVPQTSKTNNHLIKIEKASLKAAELCQQLLAYSGKGKFVVQALNLNDVIREMMHLLSVSISKKVKIRLEFNESLPYIKADVAQMQQVIMNVITNASEAIGDQTGTIHVKTDVIKLDREGLNRYYMGEMLEPGRYIMIEVTDTGEGMTPETIEKIFDPFFTTKFTGRGLGLAAVLGILRSHEASVKITSTVGQGTTFSFIFPPHKLSEARAANPVPSDEDEMWHGRGTVLLVDDDDSIREVSRQTLEQAGLQVITAENGEEAVQIYQARKKDIKLVLMDMTMPNLNGREAFVKMRNIDKNVKVILSSGYSEQEATERIHETGLLGFLQKPYKPQDLLNKIKHILQD